MIGNIKMTNKEILENNKLIAEFIEDIFHKEIEIGMKIYKNVWEHDGKHYQNLIYHKDWNWLMPILNRIGKILFENKDICRERAIYFQDWNLIDLNIEEIWETCVDFIKWYNQNKKNERI